MTATSEYDRLTPKGKLGRIGRLASFTVRSCYDIDVAEVSLYRFATNPLYLVRTTDGKRYILRMGHPGWREFDDLRAEAEWLLALDRDTDIEAPVPLISKSGEAVLKASGQGVPSVWKATLMTWLEGRLLKHYISPSNMRKFGGLFARLHIHGGEWQPPAGLTCRRFEHYLSRGEPETLFTDEALDILEPCDRDTFIKAREMVEGEYAELPRDDMRVIHCDLWHENVKLHHGRLKPFDFEDTVRGFRLHDMAMGMLDLLETVGGERYAELLPSFRSGYEEHLDWPEGNMEILQMGRMLWVANWMARFRRESLREALVPRACSFRHLMDTGELKLFD